MEITSAALKDGGKIPIQYVMVPAGGKNISIPLSWKNAPPGTKSFALSIIDPHPVAQNWVHWFVINIPASTAFLSEGASRKNMPGGAVELKNSFGETGYGGPQPPKGSGEHPPFMRSTWKRSNWKPPPPSRPSKRHWKERLSSRQASPASLNGNPKRCPNFFKNITPTLPFPKVWKN